MSRMYRGPQKMLLCVDDSPMILEFERRLFEQSGYIVVTVDSARRGLRLAMSFSFDAVLLDYHMPEMNGHDVPSEIRRLRPETRVVMVSGGVVPEETTRMVDAVVPKGDARRELLPTVDRLCGLSPTYEERKREIRGSPPHGRAALPSKVVGEAALYS